MAERFGKFLERALGATALLTGAFDERLLSAPLQAIKVHRDGLELLIEQASYLEGQVYAQFELDLARQLGLNWVYLYLKTPKGQALENDQVLSNAQEALVWLLQTGTLPGALVCALDRRHLRLNEQELVLEIPDYLSSCLDEQVRRQFAQFFRRRAGLRPRLELHLSTYEEESLELPDYSSIPVDEDTYRSISEPTSTGMNSAKETNIEGETRRKEDSAQAKKSYRRKKLDGLIWGTMRERQEPMPLSELNAETGQVQVHGQVHHFEASLIKSGKYVRCKFDLYDTTGAVACLCFVKPEEEADVTACLKKKPYVHLEAEVSYDAQFSKDLQARVLGILPGQAPLARVDRSEQKRVELHCHTKMSAQDAMADPSALVKLADSFGHPALAITDHGVVQAFPEAYDTLMGLRKNGSKMKLIYGLEAYLVDDGAVAVYSADPLPETFDAYVAIDVETTGLDCTDDRLIEVAAVRYRKTDEGFIEEASFSELINPGQSLPEKITSITGLTDMDLMTAEEAFPVLERLHDFMGDLPVVAHNALFDLGFLRAEGFRTLERFAPRLKFNPVLIDTLELARYGLPELQRHSLDRVAEALGVRLDQHHRALDDARCCGEVFNRLYAKLGAPSLEAINRLVGQLPREEILNRKKATYHTVLLVRSELGLYNLYRLVSESHTKYFSRRPRIPRSLMTYLRHGLLIGSACEAGELFRTLRTLYVETGKNLDLCFERLQRFDYKKMGRFYDYLEIQPLTNNRFLIHKEKTGITSETDLMNLNRLVLGFAKILKKPIVATCDAHYLNPEDKRYRDIMMSNMGFTDLSQSPDLYFRTTEELLEEVAYLGEEQARELVIENPKKIADMVQADIPPFPPGSYPPKIAEAETEVERLTMERANVFYNAGQGLPKLVEDRVKRELHSIISNGFAIMYYIAHKVVKKSNDDGYLVCSRGSVGSSVVATLCGITEVNPLPPHYRCPTCRYSEFDETGRYGSGYDLPKKDCPHCQTALIRDGQDIPFETFLGFDGDKQPDIDLNFSGEYQSRAHQFIREMFGEQFTFRAGTIACYAEKNALGLVRGYLEQLDKRTTQADQNRLAQGLVGVKRTTGQHPGGIVVIPKDREIYEFTPVQYPADKEGAQQTTHFDFNAMHDTILKLDILGHDDPTMLKVLGDMTGVNVLEIPVTDEKVMGMFCDRSVLGYQQPSDQQDATLGIPEMGTKMAREMIRETKPKHFFDLVQLSGLSHGTDVWSGNAQDLIREGICDINGVIGCRDGIMTTLIYKGLPAKAAFDIMEKVRKGKGLSAEQEAMMREHKVEDWYIESCKKIKYMFPKAHAVAYVTSALRVAWFKVYRPAAYYAAYFTVRADEFDSATMCRGLEKAISEREKARELAFARNAKPKDKSTFYILELVEEMHCRGISFLPISLMESHASEFIVVDEQHILPPFNVIAGFSTAMGESIMQARASGEPFNSRDDLANRAKIGPSAMEVLANEGVLEGLPVSAQIDLMEWFSAQN